MEKYEEKKIEKRLLRNNKTKNQTMNLKSFFSLILRKHANTNKDIGDRPKDNKKNNDKTRV